VAAGIASHNGDPPWIAFGAVLIGLVLASAIQLLTGYFTSATGRGPPTPRASPYDKITTREQTWSKHGPETASRAIRETV
jgi:hypothetical protein